MKAHHILVVEDEPELGGALKRHLQAANRRVRPSLLPESAMTDEGYSIEGCDRVTRDLFVAFYKLAAHFKFAAIKRPN